MCHISKSDKRSFTYMKKFCIFTAIFMFSAGLFAGEAWNNHLGFGWRMPTGLTMHNETRDYENLKMSWQTGLTLSYTGVLMSNGFSVRAIIDECFTTSNIDIKDPDSKISSLPGFNTDILTPEKPSLESPPEPT